MKYLNLGVLLTCIAVCLGINLIMGKDMNADMLAYHVYSAHMFWTGDYRDEFMGAGLQSFFNPVGYLPFYWMLKADWSSLAIASCMAAIHAANLFLIWLICRDFLFRESPRRLALSFLSVMLALASPVFIAMLGSSFLDPIQSALMLCGLYFLMHAVSGQQSSAHLLIAGVALGAATGLKPTVAATPIFAFIALTSLAWKNGTFSTALRRAVVFGASGAAGGLLTGGYWAAHLWQRFGSPVFPFANDVFKAPDFYAVPLTTDRFISQNLWDTLTFPFRMAKINSGVYVEISAPDIRFALLALALLALLLWRLSNRIIPTTEYSSSTVDAPVQLVWIIFAAVVMLWMAKLGNGRYHVMYLLLVGPLLIWTLTRLMGDRRVTALGACLILVLQFAHGLSTGYPRWESASWTDSWVRTWWPTSLDQKPATYVQLGTGIESMVFADFPPGSRFVDIGGKYPVPPDSPLARKMTQVIADRSDATFAIFKSRASEENAWQQPRTMSDEAVLQINHLLSPWNLRLADGICHPVEVELDRDELINPGGKNITLGVRRYALMVCKTAKGSLRDAKIEQERDSLARLSQQLTAACPNLFPAPASLPTQLAGVWNIRFIGSDIVVALHKGQLTYSKYPMGPFNVDIEINPATGAPVMACTSPG